MVPMRPQGDLRACAALPSAHAPTAALDVSGVRRLARDDARRRASPRLPRPRRRPLLSRATEPRSRAAPAARPRPLPDAEPLPPGGRMPARRALAGDAPRQRGLRADVQRQVPPQRAPLGRPLRALADPGRGAPRGRLRLRTCEPGAGGAVRERRGLGVELEPLRERRVERDLRHPGERLRDRTTCLRCLRRLLERRSVEAWHATTHAQRDLRDPGAGDEGDDR